METSVLMQLSYLINVTFDLIVLKACDGSAVMEICTEPFPILVGICYKQDNALIFIL